jgi:catechol 2,3-dioxygenase-like lactoylglutathione lyase family enzyme
LLDVGVEVGDRSVTITRAVPNIRSNEPAETRDFFVNLLGFEVAMDMGWVVTVASPINPSAQVSIVGNDDMAAPGISVEVTDVDAIHARAVAQGFEIAYPLRDEEWGVRRFMLRERHDRQRPVPSAGLSTLLHFKTSWSSAGAKLLNTSAATTSDGCGRG